MSEETRMRVYAAPGPATATYHLNRDCKWIVDVDDTAELDVRWDDSIFILRAPCQTCS